MKFYQILIFTGVLISSNAIAGSEGGNGGDTIAMEFKNIGIEVLNFLISQDISTINGVDLKQVQAALTTSKVITTNDSLAIEGANGIEHKDAINYPDQQLVKINLKRFENAQGMTKKQLSIHEALGLLDVKDQDYSLSYQIVSLYLKTMANNPTPNFIPAQGSSQNQTPTLVFNPPSKNNSSRQLPELPIGWTSVGMNGGSFFGVHVALEACQQIAKAYLDEYKFVVCEPIMYVEKEIIHWSEVHHQEDFVGVTVNRHIYAEERGFRGTFNVRAPNNSVTIEETSNPVIVQKPVRIEMFREETNISYGYRILVRIPLIPNTEASTVLWDSAQADESGDILTFSTSAEALAYGNRVWMDFRGFDYQCEPLKIYTTGDGRFAFRISGKKKFLNQ